MRYLRMPSLRVAAPLIFGAVASILILATPIDTWLPILWACSGLVLLVWWSTRVGDGEDARYLAVGVVIGWMLRVLFAWIIHDHPLRNIDGELFWMVGGRLELMLSTPRSTEIDFVRALGTATGVFYYVYTALHSWILYNTILLHVTNALVGVANGILAYALGRLIWDRRVGVIAAWFVWVLPIFFLHDSQNLREGFALFSILTAVYGAQTISVRWTWRGVIIFALGIGLLLQVRNYVALGILMTVALGLMVTRRSGRIRIFFVLAGVSGVLFYFIAQTTVNILWGEIARGVSAMDLILSGHQGLVDLVDRSSVFYGTELASPMDVVGFLPIGLIHALLAPLPWNIQSLQYVLYPEVIVRYIMLPFATIGFLHCVIHRFRHTFIPIAVMVALAILYSILELGGNFRHNLQFFPIMYMLAIYGIFIVSRWQLELVGVTALLSLGVWGYAFESVMVAAVYFTVLFLILGVGAALLIYRRYRASTLHSGTDHGHLKPLRYGSS